MTFSDMLPAELGFSDDFRYVEFEGTDGKKYRMLCKTLGAALWNLPGGTPIHVGTCIDCPTRLTGHEPTVAPEDCERCNA